MNSLLLLPSARLIPAELRVDFGEIPSGMIPLNSQPALRHIAAPYAAAGFDVIAAVHEKAAAVEAYVDRHPDLRARALDVGATESIGETVAVALHSLPRLPRRLVVNFADTLLEAVVTAPDAVCYAHADDLFRWTSFEAAEDARIIAIDEKDRLKPQAGGSVFVGVFACSDPAAFLALLDRFLMAQSGAVDPFWRAVQEYHNSLPPKRRVLQPAGEWKDFGHLDTYYATQRSYFLNQRCFNSMSVDLGRGVLRKSSAHAAKLAAEIDWYRALPADLQYLGPRVFDYRRDPGQTSAEMEFYGYPALNDVYLHGAWDPGVWSQVLRAIGRAVDGMRAHRLALPVGARRESLRAMYESKTAERLAPILADRRFAPFLRDSVVINGRRCAGLARCLDALPAALSAGGVYDPPEFTIIHGDLCLSNILYDRRSGFVRLIDPRGSFGASGIYGDPRYDLAKLSHSLHGDYDFYVNGLFSFRDEGGEVACRPFRGALHDAVRRMFRDWLAARQGEDRRAIRLIESLLFLSMVPLHADRPAAQLAFVARGLELFDRAVHSTPTAPTELPRYVPGYESHHHHGR